MNKVKEAFEAAIAAQEAGIESTKALLAKEQNPQNAEVMREHLAKQERELEITRADSLKFSGKPGRLLVGIALVGLAAVLYALISGKI